MLRASGQHDGERYDFSGLVDGTIRTGVLHGRELTAFADAAVDGDKATLDLARAALVGAVGPAATIDAAAVIAGFNGITRIADATGIPLEAAKAEQTTDLRKTLRIDGFAEAKW